VVKVGSSLFCLREQVLDYGFINNIASQISGLLKDKKEVVLVSSGAIALGMSVLRITSRPKELSYLQAAAAIGQNELMNVYRRAFKEKELNCAQILLTWEDFSDRKRYLNAKNTLLTLLKLDTIPIINENDSVSTAEIKFGDNDRLSALVSSLIGADLLVILSDVDGLLEKDKKSVVKVVTEINSQIKNLACPTDKKTCVGGMITKIEAAKIAVDSGIPCVIANGRKKDIILSVISDTQESGTLFVPNKGFITAKKRWIAFGTKTKGSIMVDDGAKCALLNKKSLLSVGVVALCGNFESGDVVSVVDKQSNEFARGKTAVSSKQLDKIKGERFDKEIIHRDNIAIL
jgi:glutamate 5-kinase